MRNRLASLADHPGSTQEERVQGLYLVYLCVAMGAGAVVWALLTLVLGALGMAVIPVVFLIATALNLWKFARDGTQETAWRIQLQLGVILPFVCHVAGGGLMGTGGVLLWALPSVVAASQFTTDNAQSLYVETLGFLAVVPLLSIFPLPPMAPDWMINLLFAVNLGGAITAVFALTMWLASQRQQNVRRLEDMDRMRTDFLSTVSHELRTPLTSILGFNEMNKKKLERFIFPAVSSGDQKVTKTMRQVRGNIKVIVTEGRRLTDLVNNVLDLHKIESGMMTWNLTSQPVDDLVSHAGAACSVLLMDKPAVSYTQDVPSDLPAIQVDGDRITQVLINLLSNAIKFTEQGEVGIRAASSGNAIEICVYDTGLGIAPEDIGAVFDHFQQVGDAEAKIRGSGLGLSISKKIVEDGHGGRVWVESTPGVGSEFYLSLPTS